MEKLLMGTEGRYPLVEQFYSVQGEGYWVGQPAYFIRLGGCPVECTWCDTRHSWPREGWPLYDIPTLVAQAQARQAKHVVLTGGEPTIHPLGPLIKALKEAGFFVQMETAGIGPVPDPQPDWITFSPKRFMPPQQAYYELCHELKVVIHAPSDLRWAEKQREKITRPVPAFLQPDAYQPAALQWILSYLQTHPEWRLSLQIHRYLALP
jgi:7-carboxy-7-deazaguanine synthase